MSFYEDIDSSSSVYEAESSFTTTSDDSDLIDSDDYESQSDSGDESLSGATETSPLYPGANLSVLDSCLLLLQFALRYGLTNKAFSQLIRLVEAHLPSSACCLKSVYKLKEFFVRNFPDVTTTKVYRYCSKCHQLLVDRNPCGDPECDARVDEFLMIPLTEQLNRKLSGL